MKADVGIVGLGVMGQNLALNIMDHGYTVAIFDHNFDKTQTTLDQVYEKSNAIAVYSVKHLIGNLKSPKKVLLMVKSGKPVDDLIQAILPYLKSGDIIIDGGNSNYQTTRSRFQKLKQKEIHFIGMGISGGKEGARFGPSIMVGGPFEVWSEIKKIFQDISAKSNKEPCCKWIGPDGAGHFVKTVHNGIEYGDMQLISEIYSLLKDGIGLVNEEIARIFQIWDQGKLESFLVNITAKILNKKDEKREKYILDNILDSADQKGTGKWTVSTALDFGEPLNLIGSAVFQRFMSSKIDQRILASSYYKELRGKLEKPFVEKDILIEDLENTLFIAKIICYAEGFSLMKETSMRHNWQLNLGEIASIWREGCIIRSQFLKQIFNAFLSVPNLPNLLFDDYFKKEILNGISSVHRVVEFAFSQMIPIPGIASAINYLYSYTTLRLPANLIQAQRDFFGGHGYKKIDDSSEELHHTLWN